MTTKMDNFGATVSWGPIRSSNAGGAYRLCWCAGAGVRLGGCKSSSDFIVDSGTLHSLGPSLYQSQECLPGIICTFEDYRGYGLHNGERLMSLRSCGEGNGTHGFPNKGISNAATKDGMRFGWGDGSASRSWLPLATDTPGGLFRLCWCPNGGLSPCQKSTDFIVDSGQLTMRGPHTQVNTLCATGQACKMGPWQGTLISLDDRVAVVRNKYDCMQADADKLVAGGNYKDVICAIDLSTCEASVAGPETQHGGRFKICYCVGYVDPNGKDKLACTEKTEFTAWAGMLEIRGPTGDQGFPCVVGVACLIVVDGFLLDSKDKIKLVRQTDPCSSFPVMGVPAQTKLIDAGSSQRTNPVSPVPDLFHQNNTFRLGGILQNGDYKVCYCSSILPCKNPYDFGGVAGSVQVSGADQTQVYVCKRAALCTINLKGWRLGPNDRLKVIAEGGDCQADTPAFGFGANPAWVQEKTTKFIDNTNTTSTNAFGVGVASVGTQEEGCGPTDVNCGYRLCYCPNVGGCTKDSHYTHNAGSLRVTESLRGIEIDESFAITSYSLGIKVASAYAGGIIRCVAKAGKADDWGMYADSSFFFLGPTLNDIGWGAGSVEAVAGSNKITIHLTRFVDANQKVRLWCYLSQSPNYVFPPDLDGVQIEVPQGMKKPKAVYLQRRAWHRAFFDIIIQDLVAPARRLGTAHREARATTNLSEGNSSALGRQLVTADSSGDKSAVGRHLAVADIRVLTVLSTEGCDGTAYHMEQRAMKMASTIDRFGNLQLSSTTEGQLDTTMCMDDPTCALMSCFYGGPQEYPIAMIETLPIIATPTLQTKVIHRGATNQIMVKKTTAFAGHVSWISGQEFTSRGGKDAKTENVCLSLADAKEQARYEPISSDGSGTKMVFDEEIGKYHLCLLDDDKDDAAKAPLNAIGLFDVKNVITGISPSSSASTRTTLRIDVVALRPGTVTCVVKTSKSVAAKASELGSGSAAPGMTAEARKAFVMKQRGKLWDYLESKEGTLAKVTTTVPAAIPPSVLAVLVMNKFPETTKVPVWCWHTEAAGSKITFPETATGQMFDLPGENPVAKTMPSFTWPGASFMIFIENVPDTSKSRVKLTNTTKECLASTYDQAVPVVQAGTKAEQPIQAYLKADMTKRVVCFFELPTSLALIVETEDGKELKFSQETAPESSLIISGIVSKYVHRGLPINLLLGNVFSGEDAELFILPEREYTNNDNNCLPAAGIDPDKDSLESTVDYVKRVATIGFKRVSILPSVSGGKTHFATFNEQDTQLLTIGKSFVVCYVGSSKDTTRTFNKVGMALPVRDVIVAIHQASGEKSSSQKTRLFVESSLTGDISCMVSTRKLKKAPIKPEIKGDYGSDPALPEEYKPEFKETEILGRTLGQKASQPNANTTIEIVNKAENVANVKRQPMGVPPEVYAWCFHSRSEGLIFPNNGDGVAMPLTVFSPPQFTYALADGTKFQQPQGVVLALNVSFPPLLPQWDKAKGFPQYYYDSVFFNIDPPLPEGIQIETQEPKDKLTQVGQIYAKPVPDQVSVATTYTITSQSNYDVQGSKEVKLSLSVHSPGFCKLQSAKSTEAVVACSVQDAHNMHNEALYLLLKDTSDTDTTVAIKPSSFFCYPRPIPPKKPSSGLGMQFTCMKEAPLCCCWLFLPEDGMKNKDGSRNLKPRVITGKVMKNECGLEQWGRYETYTMAAGKNPLMANADVAVANGGMFDFTMPIKPEPKPIQFEMKVDIDYEKECSPEAGPEKPQQCKDNMQKELASMLGAPSEMIIVRDVRPG